MVSLIGRDFLPDGLKNYGLNKTAAAIMCYIPPADFLSGPCLCQGTGSVMCLLEMLFVARERERQHLALVRILQLKQQR